MRRLLYLYRSHVGKKAIDALAQSLAPRGTLRQEAFVRGLQAELDGDLERGRNLGAAFNAATDPPSRAPSGAAARRSRGTPAA